MEENTMAKILDTSTEIEHTDNEEEETTADEELILGADEYYD